MILTIETTHRPATELGYLLHKNPDRVQSFDLTFGRAHVMYPIAEESRCRAALVLDIDPIELVRNRRSSGATGPATKSLAHYVNDRPYVTSSLMSVALGTVFGTALAGRSKERPELAGQAIPLVAELAAVPYQAGEELIRRFFEPLGYEVDIATHRLVDAFSDWGDAPYFSVRLKQTTTLRALLQHLYVLMPVLDNAKHYYVDESEVEKLLNQGSDWLASHPERDLITRRYLKYQQKLTREALDRLKESGDEDEESDDEIRDAREAAIERPLGLHQQRIDAVLGQLRALDARSVLDLGCGEGRLIQELLTDFQFERIVGVDVSAHALRRAADRLKWDRLPESVRSRVELLQGSLTYRDDRLTGFDAAAVIEVIEHLDPPRLPAFVEVLFGSSRPQAIVLTTPNAEYNVRWESLPAGRFRHEDHRFEWSRDEFRSWAESVAESYGYRVEFAPIGPVDDEVGPPSQLGVFRR